MNNGRIRVGTIAVVVVIFLLAGLSTAWAHFGMIVPSDDMVMQSEDRNIALAVSVQHL